MLRVLNAVFNFITVLLQRLVHLCFSGVPFTSFYAQYFFSKPRAFSHITIIETINSGQRGNDPSEMIIMSLERMLADPEIEPATSCNQMLYTTDLATRARR